MVEPVQTILIVDDVEGVRRELCFLLEDEGYQTLSAANGEEALRQLEAHPVDLVVTDILMPEMDGIELITALRDTQTQTPIIAITGGGGLALRGANLDLLQIAERLGAHFVLRKPFQSETLLGLVEQALLNPPELEA